MTASAVISVLLACSRHLLDDGLGCLILFCKWLAFQSLTQMQQSLLLLLFGYFSIFSIRFSRYAAELFCNGDGEIRTLDPLLARQVLSQLSYAPIVSVS